MLKECVFGLTLVRGHEAKYLKRSLRSNMGSEGEGFGEWQLPLAPSGAPLYLQRDEHLTHFDNSVNAVSFGFVATAILISMFIVMAIFEKFIRTTSPEASPPRGGRRGLSDVEAQSHVGGLNSKVGSNSPKCSKVHCKSCPCSIASRAGFMAFPSTGTTIKYCFFTDFYLKTSCQYLECGYL
ncbi:uncharacterized protein LOC142542635 isoform X1 [Primulina tabacum]|uniref:uncharacterized protein LOC142542635 isoform X1 n=1 Tax=Primulina tabacum TaxID=48773 RepID=UPI003F5A15C9